MDIETLRRLAKSAQERAHRCYTRYQDLELMGNFDQSSSALNDYFYWIGHAVAYKGVIAGLEIQTIVDDERDAESTCP